MRDPLDFSGRTVLVAGGSSGIGNGIALAFHDHGAEVHVWGTRSSAADYAGSEGSDLRSLQYARVDVSEPGAVQRVVPAFARLDVADAAAVVQVVDEIAAAFGGLDILVNNAGISVRRPIDDTDYAPGWERALAVMLTGPQQVVRAALPHLRRSDAARIVNIASPAAHHHRSSGKPISACTNTASVSAA